ncbi:MAG TPA: hypothetical protein VFM34_05480 [Moraxellaceae bacterium]|nr:hypothetical protein [Moraxellaceae bacterium]
MFAKNAHRLFLFSILSLLLSACAFRGSELPRDIAWPLASAGTKTVQFTVSASGTANGKADFFAANDLLWRQGVSKEFAASGLFSSVRDVSGRKEAGTTADVQIDMVGRDDKSFSRLLSHLNETSLFIVPSRKRTVYTLTSTFGDPQGQVLGIIEKKQSVVYWSHLFLAPFAPFDGNAWAEARADLVKATLAEARQLGYL